MCVIACTDAQKKCHQFLRDKEAGALTSVAQMERAKQIRADNVRRQQEQARGRAELVRVAAAREAAEQQLQLVEAERARALAKNRALEAKVGSNKKILVIGGAIIVLLGVGAVFLNRGKKKGRKKR
jgi:hypothetical protein